MTRSVPPLAVFGLALLTACATSEPVVPDVPPADPAPLEEASSWGPNDLCADTYVIITDNPRTNFSLGAENYHNNDYCAAYPYLRWLLANDPLFTGEDPDDRNYLRMAGVYEEFALEADSTERRVWLDSALAMRAEGRRALDAAGIEYESYLRDLVEGFFYFSHSAYYEDAERRQYDAFKRAFNSKPDSLEDWYLGQLLVGSALEYGSEPPVPARAAYIEQLAPYADDTATQQAWIQFATYLRTEPPAPDAEDLTDDALLQLVDTFEAEGATCDQVLSLLGVVVGDTERLVRANLDPVALQSALLRDACLEDYIDNYKTLAALAFQAYRAGEPSDGTRLFNRALEAAPSNPIRANLLYLRASNEFSDPEADISLALRYDPNHGASRFYRLRQLAQRVGQPTDTRGRVNYWCLADRFRQLAGTTSDDAVARSAQNTAARYERSGPTREQVFFELNAGPGASVTCSITGGTTRVR